jgi:hypothetical protein
MLIAVLLFVTVLFLLALYLAGSNLLPDLERADLTIRWSTESELDVVGYNLYRSDLPDGTFIRVNDELIPAAPDPLIGGEHTFVDEGVTRGSTYYYQLETVDRQGNARREGPFAIVAEN